MALNGLNANSNDTSNSLQALNHPDSSAIGLALPLSQVNTIANTPQNMGPLSDNTVSGANETSRNDHQAKRTTASPSGSLGSFRSGTHSHAQGRTLSPPSVPTSASVAVVTNDQVKILQRMDDLCARIVHMETTLLNLTSHMQEQNKLIMNLKKENSELITGLAQELRQSRNLDEHSSQAETTREPSVPDTFAIDLLNSITNVSSNYLSKFTNRSIRDPPVPRSHSDQSLQHVPLRADKSSATNNNLMNLFFNEQAPLVTANDEDERLGTKQLRKNSHSMMDLRSIQNQRGIPIDKAPPLNFSSNKNFKLNPNGIKRRKKHSSSTSTANSSNENSFTDLSGLRSLPKNANQRVSLVSGNNGAFDGLHPENSQINVASSNVPMGFSGPAPDERKKFTNSLTYKSKTQIPKPVNFSTLPSNPSPDKQTPIASQNVRAKNHVVNLNKNAVIAPTEHRKVTSLEDMEDGYQEDDDDENESDIENEVDENDDYGDDEDEEYDVPVKGPILPIVSKAREIPAGETVVEQITQPVITDPQVEPGDDLNYTLLKAPNNVRMIWEEYVRGIEGGPSIRQLEEKYGNKWRLTRNRKTYSRRKRLYKFILQGIEKGKTADEMIDALEQLRLYRDQDGSYKRRTIGWLQQSLIGI